MSARLPTEEEMSYARSVAKGRRKGDMGICLGVGLGGVVFGIVAALSADPADGFSGPGFVVLMAAVCGGALFVVALVDVFSVRSIQAMSSVWRPLRYVWRLYLALVAVTFARALLGLASSGQDMGYLALLWTIMEVVVGLPLLGTLMHLAFFVRSALRGEDDEEILARHAAGEEDARDA